MFLSFLEILPRNILAGPSGKMAELIRKYETTRNLECETEMTDAMHQTEVEYYICSLFYHYWMLKDIDQTPDPTFGVLEAVARADVATAQGYRALMRIAAFLQDRKYGGVDM